jgi:hypothetical protein
MLKFHNLNKNIHLTERKFVKYQNFSMLNILESKNNSIHSDRYQSNYQWKLLSTL